MQLKENILSTSCYHRIKLLGRGGFSEVWLAEDNKTAIKVYAPGAGLEWYRKAAAQGEENAKERLKYLNK